MKCHICQSIKHFANKCPDKRYGEARFGGAEDIKDDINITHINLFNGKSNKKKCCFIGEVFSKGILDSGCTKTVSGRTWMNEYISIVPQTYNKHQKFSKTYSTFKFGDGNECVAVENVVIPVVIGKKMYKISVDIVENEIPLLISRKTMKSLGMNMNFETDSIEIDGQRIQLFVTSTGHYCVPLTSWDLDVGETKIILHAINMADLTREKKMSKAIKLHRQFAHASKEKLVKLIKSSAIPDDKEFLKCIEECCDTCETCVKYKRPFHRPIVCLPLADRFNQVFCMDLKEFQHHQSWIFHLIDAASRYSVACIINSKKKELILQKIFRFWIAYFGIPGKFLSDNGGEFDNDEMREMGGKLGIEIRTTAAESPFSNGIVERHNKVVYEAMMKTIDDCKCDPEIALSFAVAAKNDFRK